MTKTEKYLKEARESLDHLEEEIAILNDSINDKDKKIEQLNDDVTALTHELEEAQNKLDEIE